MGQAGQSGFRARQVFRPWSTSMELRSSQSSRGTILIRSPSIFSGSDSLLRPSRPANLRTWVSTAMPSALPYPADSTMLAVFRATPGRVKSSAIVSGTRPPKSSTIFFAAPRMLFALIRKKPVDRISFSSSSLSAEANAAAVGYFLNSPGVTLFTLSSVHWAARMVATRIWKGVSNLRAVRLSGNSRRRTSMISGTRPLALFICSSSGVTARRGRGPGRGGSPPPRNNPGTWRAGRSPTGSWPRGCARHG